MSYNIIKKLPSSDDLILDVPLSQEGYKKVEQDRQEVKDILQNKDHRLLMIVGPCSAWPVEAVLQYAEKLKKMEERVKRVIKIIMRVYIQKPRTTKGWTGPINQPNPFLYPDIAAGIHYTRQMMIKVIELGLPIADEALFTHNAKGFIDLLSWVAIGARSSEDQEHRIFASAIDCPVGMKNPTHGSLAISINSIIAAQYPHVAVFDGYEVQTSGNPYAHLVLRGGNQEPNYSIAHIKAVVEQMILNQIQNPAIIIDASHDNCLVNGKKDYRLQPNIIFSILESLEKHTELKKFVKGFMVESFLQPGNQTVDQEKPDAINLEGLSITDPCLGWEQTEEMLLKLVKILDS